MFRTHLGSLERISITFLVRVLFLRGDKLHLLFLWLLEELWQFLRLVHFVGESGLDRRGFLHVAVQILEQVRNSLNLFGQIIKVVIAAFER